MSTKLGSDINKIGQSLLKLRPSIDHGFYDVKTTITLHSCDYTNMKRFFSYLKHMRY